MRTIFFVIGALFTGSLVGAGCSKPPLNGSATLINVQPSGAPPFVGAYDFDLLDEETAYECAYRDGDTDFRWWAVLPGVTGLTQDGPTQTAIMHAAFDIVTSKHADSLLAISVVSKEADGQVCATVRARPVRIWKAGQPRTVAKQPSKPSDAAAAASLPDRDRLGSPDGRDVAIAPDTRMLDQGIAAVMPAVTACKSVGHGRVFIEVEIAPSGAVVAVSPRKWEDIHVAQCVANALAEARFSPTQNGTITTLPFTL